MSREIEFTKKMILVSKLFRDGHLTDQEYNKVRQKMTGAGTSTETAGQQMTQRRRRRSEALVKNVVSAGAY